jgi:hypothetical protein
MSHELCARDRELLRILDERGIIEQGKKDTSARPRELVAERISRAFRCGKAAAVRIEFLDL